MIISYIYILSLMVVWCPAVVLSYSQYVAMAPNQQGHIKWADMTWNTANPSSASDFHLSFPLTAPKEVGSLWELDTTQNGGSSLQVTAKLLGDTLYAYLRKGPNPNGADGGCCADTLRAYNKLNPSSSFSDYNLTALLREAIPSSFSIHGATHTFDVFEEEGHVIGYFLAEYVDSNVGGNAGAIVAMDLTTRKLKRTADGEGYFSLNSKLGTFSTSASDSIYKIYYSHSSTSTHTQGPQESQWHENGLTRFISRDGNTAILAFTSKASPNVILLKDPFVYSSGNGGGKILQRFGTPKGSSSTRHFGLPSSSPSWTGCHNIHYSPSTPTSSLNGAETLTVFVNGQSGSSYSAVYEFAVNLKEQQTTTHLSDDIFSTRYVTTNVHFSTETQGGARVIGNGVYLVASGGGGIFEIVDLSGNHQSITYPSTKLRQPPPPGGGPGPGPGGNGRLLCMILLFLFNKTFFLNKNISSFKYSIYI